MLPRAVLLGIAIGGLAAGVMAGGDMSTPLRIVGSARILLVGILVLAFAAPDIARSLRPTTRIGIQSGADGGSAASRAAVYGLVADELPSRLPLGGGAGS